MAIRGVCPQCQTPRVPGARNCESCGYDFWAEAAGQPADTRSYRGQFDGTAYGMQPYPPGARRRGVVGTAGGCLIFGSGLALVAPGLLVIVGQVGDEYYLFAVYLGVIFVVLAAPPLLTGFFALAGGRLGQLLAAIVGWMYGASSIAGLLQWSGADAVTQAAVAGLAGAFLLGALLLTVALFRRLLRAMIHG